MALSFINTCYYQNCGMNFNSQHQLIIHIENVHVDFNPKTIEEVEKTRFQHAMVPPSYVLKYNLNNELFPCDISIKEESLEEDSRFSSDYSFLNSYDSMFGLNPDNVIVKVEPLDLNKLEFQGLLIDDSYKKMTPDKSLIISQGGKKKRIPPLSENARKFACPIFGCNKKYKNINGARYHTKHCHDSFGNTIKPKKDYHCACGKQYKTASGLRNHLQVYSDKNNHGVILTNINQNDINNNKNIMFPRQIATLCPNACGDSFNTCHISSPCQSTMSDMSGVGSLSGDSFVGRSLWQMKCEYGSAAYDNRIRIFNGVGDGLLDTCHIKCKHSEYQFENKNY